MSGPSNFSVRKIFPYRAKLILRKAIFEQGYELNRRMIRKLEGRPLVQTEDDVSVFIFPWGDVNGGRMSILHLASTSQLIGIAEGFDTHLSGIPGLQSGARSRAIPNSWTLTNFLWLSKRYRHAKRVWIHIPEIMINDNLLGNSSFLDLLKRFSGNLTLNILNQNILAMPRPHLIENLKQLGFSVTTTTAHLAYSHQDLAEKLNIPVHHWSVWVDKSQYFFARNTKKRDSVLISNDKIESFCKVKSKIEDLVDPVLIDKMSYRMYLKHVFQSQWSITFGEGLDAYFVEMAFSGGIPLAAFNSDFFTPDFKDLPNVFASESDLISGARDLIASTPPGSNRRAEISAATIDLLDKQYNYGHHLERVHNFYLGKYDYVPQAHMKGNVQT